jgi:hypothetical protein
MRALWAEDEASYSGEFVSFGPSWAWPKPVGGDVPVLMGAAGTEKAFSWLVRHADGWISTPRETDITASVKLLNRMWDEAGRSGRPEIVVLGPRPDPQTAELYEGLGVSEIMIGLPDRDTDEVLSFIERRGETIRQLA